MLVMLALFVLVGRLVADGYLPVWTFYLLLVLVMLGGIGGLSRIIQQTLRIGGGLTAAIIFFVILEATRPTLVRPYLGIVLQLLIVYVVLRVLARGFALILGAGRPDRR